MEAMEQLADWRLEQEARREALTDALATATRRRAEAEAHVVEISAYNSAILEQSQVSGAFEQGIAMRSYFESRLTQEMQNIEDGCKLYEITVRRKCPTEWVRMMRWYPAGVPTSEKFRNSKF